MAQTLFPKLLEPITISGHTLRNRVLMGSMHTGLEDAAFFTPNLEPLGHFLAKRAKGGVGIIVTGGIAPNRAGMGHFTAGKLTTRSEMEAHKVIPEMVHEEGGKIAMQILHTGRYAYHSWGVSPSPLKSPISWFQPKELSGGEVEDTIDDFVRCASLAQEAGYDGVEIMGSEGYLINQFIASRTNKRTDEWGGPYENRIRFPIEIVRRTREAVGPNFIIIYRLSMLDLVQEGSSWEQIVQLAREIEQAGASVINTGIGWHEAQIPTIATSVPRGAFSQVTQQLKGEVQLPLCTTNRVNSPGVGEEILQRGYADLVSMARPLLADPDFVLKAMEGRQEEINTCIGCNQACLDHVFEYKRVSCLVNPEACNEDNLQVEPIRCDPLRVAVIGSGPGGLACATTAAERGHRVTLFERDSDVGGQFNLAKKIPEKGEFYETIRYFKNKLQRTNVDVRLNTEPSREDLVGQSPTAQKPFDAIVFATGVVPRHIPLQNLNDPRVVSYAQVLSGEATVGRRVAVIGAGGIGYDVSEYLSNTEEETKRAEAPLKDGLDDHHINTFLRSWGIDTTSRREDQEGGGGGVLPHKEVETSGRTIYLCQRKDTKFGTSLGKTTGWIHRKSLQDRGVILKGGVSYEGMTEEGLVLSKDGQTEVLPVDTVVVCAGQEANRTLYDEVKDYIEMDMRSNSATSAFEEPSLFLIGGALEALELDAKRAIDQGTRLAAQIETAPAGSVFNMPEGKGEKMFKVMQRFMK